MVDYYSESDFQTIVKELSNATKDFNLVVFIGAGISLSQGYPNWNDYVDKLIHYWQFNYHQLTESEEHISTTLLSQFDEIAKSSVTNKRKIDLLHTLLRQILGEQFEERKLDFEKYYFKKVIPKYPENNILVELTKLDPIFVTSNYDFEIEKHLTRFKQKSSFKTINNIAEFYNLSDGLKPGDILHLHGTTDGDSNFFVNSSLDYSRQYLKRTIEFNKLKKWFEDKKPVVLFIGSSMEEEEILSLLPTTTKNFAIMKANPEESNEFRELYNYTLQNNNNTTIYWFSDDFNNLHKEIQKIVREVQANLEVPESIDDWTKLHSVTLTDEEYTLILKKYINNERFLYDLFKVDDNLLENKILKIIFSNNNILKQVTNIVTFWGMVGRNFSDLEDPKIKQIFEIFEDQEFNRLWEETYIIFDKLISTHKFSDDKLAKIRINLSKNPQIIETSFYKDKDLMGFWIVDQFRRKQKNTSTSFYIEEEIYINLSSESIEELSSCINDISMYEFISIKEIISNPLEELLSTSILEGKIEVDGIPIKENFPEKLLETVLIQRILVKIDNDQSLNKNLLTQLIQKIDFSVPYFGEELNNFVENNKAMIKSLEKTPLESYHNAVSSIQSGTIREQSFIDIEQVIKENLDTLEKLITPSEEELARCRSSIFVEKTYEKTAEFILTSIKSDGDISLKLKKLLLEKAKKLFPNYEKLYFQIILDQETESQFKQNIEDVVSQNFNRDRFTWEEETFFRELTNKGDFDNPFFNKLLEINVEKLNYDNIHKTGDISPIVEVKDFINTELGNYLNILIGLSKNQPKMHEQIQEKISKVSFKPYKDFATGAIVKLDEISELDINVNTFQGYSYSIRGVLEQDREIFKSVALNILENGYVDSWSEHNLFLISLNVINPKDENVKIKWDEINFSLLLDIVTFSKEKYIFDSEWIESLVLNDVTGSYLTKLVYLSSEDKIIFSKFKSVANVFKQNIADYPSTFPLNIFSHKLKNEVTDDIKEIIIDLFFEFLNNKKINANFFTYRNLTEIMPTMSFENQKKLVSNDKLDNLLSPLEIEALRRTIN